MSQHAIAKIAQIGCTGAEIRIVRRIESCDFRIDCSAPCSIRGLATFDQRKRRRSKIVVFQQSDLERENGFRLRLPCFAREKAERLLGRREGIDESLVLLRHGSMLTDIVLDRSQAHERSQRNSGGGGPPLDAMRSSMRSIVHPQNLRQQASPCRPARPSHPSPPRENKCPNPSAPWSPLP